MELETAGAGSPFKRPHSHIKRANAAAAPPHAALLSGIAAPVDLSIALSAVALATRPRRRCRPPYCTTGGNYTIDYV